MSQIKKNKGGVTQVLLVHELGHGQQSQDINARFNESGLSIHMIHRALVLNPNCTWSGLNSHVPVLSLEHPIEKGKVGHLTYP